MEDWLMEDRLMEDWRELASATTDSGERLVLRRRAGIVELRCNGWELMTNRAHHSEEALAILACEQMAGRCIADAPNRSDAGRPCVLLGGLGLGYTLRAALDRLPVSARVIVAELLPELIAWNRGILGPFAGHALSDPRVSVACTDVLALLRSAEPASFDAILLDTDNGPDAVMLAANALLYLPDGLRVVCQALRPHGTLAVWSADRSPRFERNLHDAGLQWRAHDVPARGGPDDPLHTVYVAWQAA